MQSRCFICGWYGFKKLCPTHKRLYVWDSKIKGFRLKKRCNGSRYTTERYHISETRLVKMLEKFFGKEDIITSYHPIWAVSDKNVLYEYDALIKSLNILVEYNGIQHYFFNGKFHKSSEDLKRQQEHDREKVRLAKENKYKLVVFKYDEPDFEDYVINKVKL